MLITVATVIVIAIIALAVRPAKKEPEYKGKKLSEWLAMPEGRSAGTIAAIKTVGTNALPMLASWMKCEPPFFADRILVFYAKHPAWAGAQLVQRKWGQAARDERRRQAIRSFFMLGEEAGGAASHLQSVARSCDNPQHTAGVLSCLGCIGKPGLPALLEVAADKKRADRAAAVNAIYRSAQRYGTDGGTAVPVIVQCLQTTNTNLQIIAAKTVGRMRMRPDIAVPALAQTLRSNDRNLRLAAMEALVEFHASGRPALPMVKEVLTDPDASVRSTAEAYLQTVTWED